MKEKNESFYFIGTLLTMNILLVIGNILFGQEPRSSEVLIVTLLSILLFEMTKKPLEDRKKPVKIV